MIRKSPFLVVAAFAALDRRLPGRRGSVVDLRSHVLKHMWALGMDSSHTWDLSQTLSSTRLDRDSRARRPAFKRAIGSSRITKRGASTRSANSTARGADGRAATHTSISLSRV